MLSGNSQVKHLSRQVAPFMEASVVNCKSSNSQCWGLIKEVPLKKGKKASHQSMSACMSTETLSRARVDGKARRLFNKQDIKM